jgi:hypothetical protein
LLASAALAASGPAAAMGGFGGGHIGGLGGDHFWRFLAAVHGLGWRGATATVARELESEIHGLLFFETLCLATYAVNATGKAVQQTLRCASDSYRVEISSNVISDGGSLSGSWAEATRGVSGRASGAEIVANVAGAGFTARLDVRIQGERQSVTIRPQGGTDVTACRSLCANDKARRYRGCAFRVGGLLGGLPHRCVRGNRWCDG